MSQERVGGIIQFKINGEPQKARGNFSYNLGLPLKEMVVGSDGTHGYKTVPQPAFIEGEITDGKHLKLAELVSITDATIMLNLANGKAIALYNGVFTGEGTGNSEEGNIPVRFGGKRAKEIS